MGRQHPCGVTAEELGCVLHFRHERNLCHCPFKFEVSHLLNPVITNGPREIDCTHCWRYTTEAFCTYHLAEMGAMQCYNKCVSHIGATRPFHQESDLGRSFYTYIGAASGNCNLKKAEMSQYKILNHYDIKEPVVDTANDWTTWDSRYNQKIKVDHPGRDQLFSTTASNEELADRAAALWEVQPFKLSKIDSTGEGQIPTPDATLVHIGQTYEDNRPIFKKFHDTYAAGGGGGSYSTVGGLSLTDAQALEQQESQSYTAKHK